MLIYRVLPKLWWGHTILYAAAIRNSCTTGNFKNKEIPYGRFFNKEVDLKVFKPFGFTALVYIPLENRTKLDCTVERGFLVGVAEDLLCYKVYFTATKSTFHARDVTFIEEPYKKLFANDTTYIEPHHQAPSSQQQMFTARPNLLSIKKRQVKSKASTDSGREAVTENGIINETDN